MRRWGMTAIMVGVAAVAAIPWVATAQVEARQRVVHLPGGGRLVVPKSSLSPGAHVVARRAKQPRARKRSALRSLGKPISLRALGGEVVGPIRLTLPYRKRVKPLGMPLRLTVEIAYFSAATRQWLTLPARVNPRRRRVSAVISPAVWNEANLVVVGKGAHAAADGGSSWWNPFSWDWANVAARLSQRIGELRGGRTGPAPCTSGVGVPSWAAQVITNNGAELQLRTCAEGEDDNVVVQIVNNRPYGVILKYGASVAWGWHEVPGTVSGDVAAMLADQLVSPNELYIPPLKRASVGIPRGDWFFASFQASITAKSLAADALAIVADQVDMRGVRPQAIGKLATACTWLLKPGTDGSVAISSNVADTFAGVSECLMKAAPSIAAEGLFDRKKVSELEHGLAVLSRINRAAEAAKVAGAVADLFVGVSPSMQGNMMFSVRRRYEDPGPLLVPAPTPAPAPVPVPVPVPPASSTWAEQQGSLGANTFLNPTNASGMGVKIQPYQWVQVSCKVHAPQIASANPDGYWYRIASAPWNNAYYAVANTFWNGDVPGQKPYTHNTDFAVRNC